MKDVIIMKFGGTSVGKPERMKKIAQLVTATPGRKVVVLSALSGTTNTLVAIGEALYKGNSEEAAQLITGLQQHYEQFVRELYSTEAGLAIGQEIVSRFFIFLKMLAASQFDDKSNRELLAQGELLSTELFYQHLQEIKIVARLLPALYFMSIDENEEPELEKISARLKPLLESMKSVDLIVTQGYICRNHRNEIDNLKRGGSDYTASLIGAAIGAREIQIWTDIDGMHNNDPRIVGKTVPISHLTFDEASELAYFGAKILHPSTIVPAQKTNVPVRLKNTLEETAPGTLITGEGIPGSFKAVAAKDGIIAINIKSSRMLLAYGFLRRVFEIFEKYKTPIDMITTSEVAVSLTIDQDKNLDSLLAELANFGTIQVEREMTIVCVVGHHMLSQPGVLGQILGAVREIPVKLVSAGGSNNNVSMLIESKFKKEVLLALNRDLFGLEA